MPLVFRRNRAETGQSFEFSQPLEGPVQMSEYVLLASGVPLAGGIGATMAASPVGPVDEGSSLLADHDIDDGASEAAGPTANGNTAAGRANSTGPSQGAFQALLMQSKPSHRTPRSQNTFALVAAEAKEIRCNPRRSDWTC